MSNKKNNKNGRKIHFGDIILILILYGIGEEAFHSKAVGALFALAAACFVIFTTGNRRQGQKSPAKTKSGRQTINNNSKEEKKTDILYSMYSSVIDQYHSTPLPLFTSHLGKNRKEVLQDLNTLISKGRFQRAHIEYDENAFVVDEYTKERGSQEERSSFAAGLAQKKSDLMKLAASVAENAQTEEIRETVEKINTSASAILDKTAESPELAETDTRRFLNFYLPKTKQCLMNYQRLLQISNPDEQELSAKQETESALKTIAESFERLLKSLSSEDIFEMSAQAQALKQMLENDAF
ncbi:MAG: 5-bromo-4-chloroindolyl phosphate hydrolysis family protein [Eubacterium sp.]